MCWCGLDVPESVFLGLPCSGSTSTPKNIPLDRSLCKIMPSQLNCSSRGLLTEVYLYFKREHGISSERFKLLTDT